MRGMVLGQQCGDQLPQSFELHRKDRGGDLTTQAGDQLGGRVDVVAAERLEPGYQDMHRLRITVTRIRPTNKRPRA